MHHCAACLAKQSHQPPRLIKGNGLDFSQLL
ncbi:Uncharacterised protein [Vibrio cholerae]|nr:Uncharacterised protein [Vibrio cholerae]